VSDGRRLLTTREVAERLTVAPETILRWIDDRGLPARRLTSRAIRFDADELEAWLAERATGADGATREVSPTRNAARPEADSRSSFSASPTPLRELAASPEED
jgi:excisionase family DNA binding protein